MLDLKVMALGHLILLLLLVCGIIFKACENWSAYF